MITKTNRPAGFKPPHHTLGEFLGLVATILDSPVPNHLSRDFKRFKSGDLLDTVTFTDLCSAIFVLPPLTFPRLGVDALSKFKQAVLNSAYTRWVRDTNISFFLRASISLQLRTQFATPLLHSSLKEFFTNSKDNSLLDDLISSSTPIVRVWELLKEQHPRFNDFRSVSSGLSKEEMENSLDWITGKHVPKWDNLAPFLEKFFAFAKLSKDAQEIVNSLFFSAKCLHNFSLLTPVEKISPQINPMYTNSFNFLSMALSANSSIRSQVGTVSKSKIEEVLVYLDSFAPHPEVHWWQRSRLHGKYALFSGDSDTALELYKECMRDIWYTGDEELDIVYKEALALAAHLHDRPFLKQLKQQGILFGLFGKTFHDMNATSVANKKSRSKDHLVEDWEVQIWAKEFYPRFPKECFWAAPPKCKLPLPNNGLMFVDLTLPPDFSKPNKIISSDGKSLPQLVYFVEAASIQAVKEQDYYVILERLLSEGANVNALTSSGESALLMLVENLDPFSLFNSPSDFDRIEQYIDLITKYPHTADCLSTALSKKKKTVLGSAVMSTRPSIVRKVVGLIKSAEPKDYKKLINQIQSEDLVSPLYRAVSLLKKPSQEVHNYSYYEATDPTILEGIRRGNPALYGKTHPEIRLYQEQLKDHPAYEFLRKLHDDVWDKISHKDVHEIITLLLDNKADPNQLHDIGDLLNYTPLMLAAEFDELEIFKLLEHHGGDRTLECTFTNPRGVPTNITCYEVAQRWESKKVLAYLAASSAQ